MSLNRKKLDCSFNLIPYDSDIYMGIEYALGYIYDYFISTFLHQIVFEWSIYYKETHGLSKHASTKLVSELAVDLQSY